MKADILTLDMIGKEDRASFDDILDDKLQYSYKRVLEALNSIDSIKLALHNNLILYIDKARKEVFEKMAEELKIEKISSHDSADKIFIIKDSSDVYADYVYYYDEKNQIIIEERLPLGD